MPSEIRPTRLEISDRFPVAGFTVRTDTSPGWFEVAIATEPGLFKPDQKAKRTRSNFYSSRAGGPLPAERGEAVYLIPQEILTRFIGAKKLYVALATFADPGRSQPEIARYPSEGSPYLNLSTFTGRTIRRSSTGRRSGYGGAGYGGANDGDLEWAGDMAQPGTAPIVASPAVGNGHAPANGASAPKPVAKASQSSLEMAYSDGFDDDLWSAGALGDDGDSDANDDDDSHDIGGPIQDGGPSSSAQSYGRQLEATAPEYPQASRFAAAAAGNYRARTSPRTINRIVIHITDGGANINGTVGWFQNPAAKVSAHYVVGQDGEVVQMVRHQDVAWHAGGANGDSIGIEHVANTKGLVPTDAEYCASAALVSWLCDQFGIPMDRAHILGHSEADPKTTHKGCPNAVWDWDYYMDLVTSRSCHPRGQSPWQSQAFGGAEFSGAWATGTATLARHKKKHMPHTKALATTPLDVAWADVELVPDQGRASCWAAALAMVVGWRDRMSIDPAQIEAKAPGGDRAALATAWDVTIEPNAAYDLNELCKELVLHGPLWAAAGQPRDLHAFVITAMCGDGTEDGTVVTIDDPWGQLTGSPAQPKSNPTTGQGSTYVIPFRKLAAQYNPAMVPDPATATHVALQLIYSKTLDGRTPTKTGCTSSQGLSYVPSRRDDRGHGYYKRPRAMGGQSFDVDYADVDLVPQPTNMSCWATAAALLVGWRDQVSITPDFIAQGAGRTTKEGLNPASKPEVAAAWGLRIEPPQSYTIDGFRDLLANNGPLWVGIVTPSGSKHAVVVTGLYSDGAPDGSDTFVRITDPWDRTPGTPAAPGPYLSTHNTGTRYVLSWDNFVKEYEGAISQSAGQVNVQIIHTGGRPSQTSTTSQGFSDTAYGLGAMAADAIDRLKATTVANAARAKPAKLNCLDILNAALRQLYESKLKDPSGALKPLGSSVQGTMAKLQEYGLAGDQHVVQFRNAAGKITSGIARPEALNESVEAWVLAQCEANAQSGWYVFGLSVMDGYHSVQLAVSFSGTSSPLTRVYWVDQIYNGWDDVTGAVDDRITRLTQGWWDSATPKPKTRATIWPLYP
jgi:N-acetyl-anhydromuramyl-L-alanine amidase AmpD